MCTPIGRKRAISPANNQCNKTPCYTQNHSQKYFCFRTIVPWKMYVNRTKKSMPGMNHSHFWKNIFPWIVGQNWRASKKKGWTNEWPEIIVMLTCLDLKSSRGKKMKKKKETSVYRIRFHDFGIKYIVSNGWRTYLSDLVIKKWPEEGHFFVCDLVCVCALVHLLCMFVGGGRGWVHRCIITQNGV